MIDLVPNRMQAGLGHLLNRAAVILAYAGGIVVSAIGLISAVSIIGRSALGRPITGDFELVEIGTAVAGSLFLPYCQATNGHIIVDFFTLQVGAGVRTLLDRMGYLLLAIMFLVIGWRTSLGCLDMQRNGETSMLLGFPTWLGYAGTIPGVILAAATALAQSLGVTVSERVPDEQD